MCNEPRVNQSSIRYSDKVRDIVDSCPGKTFGDRFEFAVLSYVDAKAEREKELAYLDSMIKKRRDELSEVYSKIEKHKNILNGLERLKNSLYDVFKLCNTNKEAAEADPELQHV